MTTENLPALTDEQRKLFHSIFNEWLVNASEQDYAELEAARERHAPGQVCSMIRLVRGCLADQELIAVLPATLLERLRARNWLRPSVVAKSA